MTADSEALGPLSQPFRVAFVPGAAPDKWARIWRDRMRVSLALIPVSESEQLSVLLQGKADMALVRLPMDRTGLSVIPLYREVPVVVASKEHPIAAFDEVSVVDLADEHLLQDPAEVPEWQAVAVEVREGTRYPVPELTTAEAIETCAAGTGIVIVPMSVARLHHRKDVVYRPVTGVAESQVGLAWLSEETNLRTETFVGIVRGRTQNSSRTPTPQPKPRKAAAPKAPATKINKPRARRRGGR